MDQDKKSAEEKLNSKLRQIADRNDRFAIVEQEMKKLGKDISSKISNVKIKIRAEISEADQKSNFE